MESRRLMASGHPIVVAALGDSLTDEYTFPSPSTAVDGNSLASPFGLPSEFNTFGRNSARNWVEDLAANRSSQLTFGAYSTVSRGEIRNQGYAEDWARGGATSSGPNLDGSRTTFAEQYQGIPSRSHPGLLTQTVADSGYSPKEINVVTISIGTNDYGRGLVQYTRSLGQNDVFVGKKGGPNPINSRIEASIQAAVAQIGRTIPKAKIIIVTPPDITTTPLVEAGLAMGGFSSPGLVGKVSASLKKLGDDLSAFARRQTLGLVNTQALENQLRAAPTVAGLALYPQGSGQDITNWFVNDGYHPGTIVQGRLAQAIVAKVDSLYGSKVIDPLTDSEIVSFARAEQPTLALSVVTPPGLTTNSRSILEAVVTPGPGHPSVPTGFVTFGYPDPAAGNSPVTPRYVFATVALDGSGRASFNATPALVNPRSIIAVYGDDQFNEARYFNALDTSSTSNALG